MAPSCLLALWYFMLTIERKTLVRVIKNLSFDTKYRFNTVFDTQAPTTRLACCPTEESFNYTGYDIKIPRSTPPNKTSATHVSEL